MSTTYHIRFGSIKDNYNKSQDVFRYKNELNILYVDLLKSIKRHMSVNESAEELVELLDVVDYLLYQKELVA